MPMAPRQMRLAAAASCVMAAATCTLPSASAAFNWPVTSNGARYSEHLTVRVYSGARLVAANITGDLTSVVERIGPDEITVSRSGTIFGNKLPQREFHVRRGGIGVAAGSGDEDIFGLFIDESVWGDLPESPKQGARWSVSRKAPWQYGPPGLEQVSVVSFDEQSAELTLEAHGSGTGANMQEIARASALDITVQGVPHHVQVRYGRSTWTQRATYRGGVLVSNYLDVTQSYEQPAIDLLPPQTVSTRTVYDVSVSSDTRDK